MKISIETLRKTKGIGSKTLERIIEQHNLDNKIKSFESKYISSDIYKINKDINLWQGDCLELMNHIPDKSVDMILIDPPYKITSRGSHGGTGGMLKDELSKKGSVFKHNDLQFEQWLPSLYRALKNEGHAYIMVNNKNLKNMLIQIEKSGFKVFKTLVWKKNTAITNMYYMDSHEYIIFCRKGNAKKINKCGTKSVLEFNNPTNKYHPTEKPTDLLECLIKNSSNEGDIVLDCFMGSGSTGVACKNTNRKFIGIELDKDYFNIAKERICNNGK